MRKAQCPNRQGSGTATDRDTKTVQLSDSLELKVAGFVEAKSEGPDLVLAVTIFYGRFKDERVLDSACTFHMSPEWEMTLLGRLLVLVQSK